MKGHGEKLSRKQEQAILALIERPTIAEAAQACGVSEGTLWRWLQATEFQAAYRAARSGLLETALTRLQGASGEAVNVLGEVMRDKQAPPSSRVTAAVKVLELTLKARAELELEARLRALEERLQDAPPGRKFR
jgi:DNA-binding MurR/RpiR family transcriptional regulator